MVRGPQGVLLGKNVAGGAVNIISNKPSAQNSAAVTASIGNYSLRQFQGYINGAIAEDLNGRIAFQSYKHAGYAKDLLHHTDVEDADSIQARAQLAWEPAGTGFKALLIADSASQWVLAKDRRKGSGIAQQIDQAGSFAVYRVALLDEKTEIPVGTKVILDRSKLQ